MDITRGEEVKRLAVTTVEDKDPVVRLTPILETDGFATIPEISGVSFVEAALVLPAPPSEIETGGYFADVQGHRAVVGSTSLPDRRLDTLLSEGTFDKNRVLQDKYAQMAGYRIAKRSENLAYVTSLLAKEDARTINDAEKAALEIYRSRQVRDDLGAIEVNSRDVFSNGNAWVSRNLPRCGALLVRASEIPARWSPVACLGSRFCAL